MPSLSAIVCPQAYTSQFISLVMFGLMMSEDRISLQDRRREIIQGLQSLPGMSQNKTFLTSKSSRLFWAAVFLTLTVNNAVNYALFLRNVPLTTTCLRALSLGQD